MSESFGKALNEYYEKFGVDFPFGFQVVSEETALRDIRSCLKKNVKAEILFPDKYGSLNGKLF